MTARLTRGLGGAVGRVLAAAQAFKNALLSLDVEAARAAWRRMTGLVGAAGRWLSGAGRALFGRLGTMWSGARARARGALDGARNLARSAGAGIRSLASGATRRLSSLWGGLRSGASRLAEFTGVPRVIRAVVSRLASVGRRTWGGIQSGWGALRDRAGGLLSSASRRVGDVWGAVRGRARGVMDRVGGLWTSVRERIRGGVSDLSGGLSGILGRFAGFPIGSLLSKLAKSSRAIRAVEGAVRNPREAMEPIIAPVADQLQSGMPAAGVQELERRGAAAGVTGGLAPAPASGRAGGGAGPAMPVQRLHEGHGHGAGHATRGTESFGAIWEGLKTAIAEKWEQLNVREMLWHVVKSLVWPWPGVGDELGGLWNDWKAAVGSFFVPRNPLRDPLGCLHDLWSNLLVVIDFPLVLWRRINNIALLLWGWITIGLTVLGAVGGTVAGTVIGAIASALVSLGIAAPAGAGAGAAAGGLGGAAAGFGTAMALGQAFVVSFAAGEATAILKALIDLKTARQTDEEKVRDYNQAADSALALGILGVLLALAWIGGRIAAAAMRGLKRVIPPSLQARAGRLFGRERPPGETPPAETRPGETRPGETRPAENRPGDRAEPARSYDPRTRTTEQLRRDADPTPRRGETPEQAQARSRAAREELRVREAVEVYDALGPEPPRVRVREHDAANRANGAHTIERHGPEVPLRRGDASPGSRTIEGRIHGDPPWGNPQNWSYRWMNDSVMQRTVQDYIRTNWERIRSDLALDGQHSSTFNAGRAVGEGFHNSGQGGVGPRTAVYHVTSNVTIVIRLVPGARPPRFYIHTTFPAGRGI